jgi:hypothetical protein
MYLVSHQQWRTALVIVPVFLLASYRFFFFLKKLLSVLASSADNV